MPNDWVAVDAGTDALPWARLIRRAYDSAASGCKPAPILRPGVVQSWSRSEAAGVDPLTPPPLVMDPEDATRRFDAHPIRPLLPHIEALLLDVARDVGQVVAIADVGGLVLWTGGHIEMASAAKRIHLVPGALWSESQAGTNALAMAVALDHGVQIFSAEHFKRPIHGWSSAAAPVHGSKAGTILGVVSLSGPIKAAHPHGLSLVLAAARIAEAEFAHQSTERNERLKVEFLQRVLRGCGSACAVVNAAGQVLLSIPPDWLGKHLDLAPDGTFVRPPREALNLEPLNGGAGFLVRRACDSNIGTDTVPLRLQALGRDHAHGWLGRQWFEFTRRHSEILVILALHPAGLSEDELMLALHREPRKVVTVRAEISRLHKLLGPVVQTRPYRLATEVRADFADVERLVAAGVVDAAVKRYIGPLLPSSSAPGVVSARGHLDSLVRRVALSGNRRPRAGRRPAVAVLTQTRGRRFSGS